MLKKQTFFQAMSFRTSSRPYLNWPFILEGQYDKNFFYVKSMKNGSNWLLGILMYFFAYQRNPINQMGKMQFFDFIFNLATAFFLDKTGKIIDFDRQMKPIQSFMGLFGIWIQEEKRFFSMAGYYFAKFPAHFFLK